MAARNELIDSLVVNLLVLLLILSETLPKFVNEALSFSVGFDDDDDDDDVVLAKMLKEAMEATLRKGLTLLGTEAFWGREGSGFSLSTTAIVVVVVVFDLSCFSISCL